MGDDLSYGAQHNLSDWGCSFLEIKGDHQLDNIFVCHVEISDITKISEALSHSVMDDSWIMNLDKGAKRAYTKTVADTAAILVSIFKGKLLVDDKISGEFGEIMVSMGSSKALEALFNHISLPISELWKPQVKGNEGFDFHTVCPDMFVNFGEAKFSNSTNPYSGPSGGHSGAAGQADGFFKNQKHLRDYVHLVNLVDEDAIDNLGEDKFGAVLAFSLNAKTPFTVFGNAISILPNYPELAKAEKIYIVGVSHDS